MKYLVKNNVFALGRLYKAGTEIDIEKKDEYLFKGEIEKVTAAKPRKKAVAK